MSEILKIVFNVSACVIALCWSFAFAIRWSEEPKILASERIAGVIAYAIDHAAESLAHAESYAIRERLKCQQKYEKDSLQRLMPPKEE